MYQQPDQHEQERVRFQKRRTDESIAAAMESRWEEAVQANRDIIAMQPNDHHAYNRLGKALMELGQYGEARDAYSRAIELDATNAIARKNLARLAALGEEGPVEPGQKLSPDMFIAETGKTGVAVLENPDPTVFARLTPGDQVELRRNEASLTVHTVRGERIGEVGPPLGLRLANLMEGGNLYAAAIVSVEGDQCRIIIREVFQDPSQEGRLSFPAGGTTQGENFRPYTRARLVRSDAEPASDDFEDEGEDEWEDTEPVAEDETVETETEARLPEEADDDDEIEE